MNMLFGCKSANTSLWPIVGFGSIEPSTAMATADSDDAEARKRERREERKSLILAEYHV